MKKITTQKIIDGLVLVGVLVVFYTGLGINLGVWVTNVYLSQLLMALNLLLGISYCFICTLLVLDLKCGNKFKINIKKILDKYKII